MIQKEKPSFRSDIYNMSIFYWNSKVFDRTSEARDFVLCGNRFRMRKDAMVFWSQNRGVAIVGRQAGLRRDWRLWFRIIKVCLHACVKF